MPHYQLWVELTGIDAAAEMLAKARDKVAERLFAPLAGWTGWWQSDFEPARVLTTPGQSGIEETHLPPFGIMTLLRLRRD